MVQVHLNGEPRAFPDGVTVAELVDACGLRPEIVAVEVNRELVARARRTTLLLRDGDQIEVVTLVGGG